MGQQQWVDIPLPRTLNVDSGPLRSPGEAADIYNFLTHEPGQIRQRLGWQGVSKLQGVADNAHSDEAFNIVTAVSFEGSASNPSMIPSRAIVGIYRNQSGKSPMYRLAFPSGPYPSGYTEIGSANVLMAHINADNPNSVTIAAQQTPSGGTLMMPYGQTANADFSTLGTSVGRFSAGTKAVGSWPGGPVTAARLVRWGGANKAVTTKNVTINNGSTIGSIPAGGSSLTGMYMNFGLNDTQNYRYNYFVASHNTGTGQIILSKPYGLGESAANVPNKAGVAANFDSIQVVQNSPVNAQCVCVYLGRVFIGRPTVLGTIGAIVPGDYPQAIAWSDPGEVEKWTDTNIAILDQNTSDPVMGFATLTNSLVIFRRYSTWIMTGADETTFVWRKVSNEIGCLHSNSIVQYRNGVFFMSDSGIYYYDGYQFQNMTSQDGHGWGSVYRSDQYFWTYTTPLSQQSMTVIPRTDFLIAAASDQVQAQITPNDMYMLHIPSRSWVRVNCDTSIAGPEIFTKPGQHLNLHGTGVSREAVLNLDPMVREEFSLGLQLGARYDQSFSLSTGNAVTAAVKSQVQLADWRPGNGTTMRVHRLMFEHAIFTDTSTPGGILGYRVTCGVDPQFNNAYNVGSIVPRYEAAASGGGPNNYRYSTELNGTDWPIEGTTFRIMWSTVPLVLSTPSYPPKFLGLRALIENTDKSMVDNAIVS